MSKTVGNKAVHVNGATVGASPQAFSVSQPAVTTPPRLSSAPTLAPAPAIKDVRPDAGETSRAFNRDLSWLEFNRRVLHQATVARTPLLERVRIAHPARVEQLPSILRWNDEGSCLSPLTNGLVTDFTINGMFKPVFLLN